MIDDYYKNYITYLFKPRTQQVKTTTKYIIEPGKQILTFVDVSIKPISPLKCAFILEFNKITDDLPYWSIMLTYNITMDVNRKVDYEGQKMSNFFMMAFHVKLDFKKNNFIGIYEEIKKLKKSQFNALIALERTLQLKNKRPIVDTSTESIRVFGENNYLCYYKSKIVSIKYIDDQFFTTDYNIDKLLLDYSEKDKTIINNFNYERNKNHI